MFRYRLIRFFMNLVRLILGVSLHVTGREKIPAAGPYIVVLNHTSVVDTPVLLMTFPLMKWRFFAVEKWKFHPIYGPIMAWLGAIYVKRGEIDRTRLREALAALQDGTVFGLAPEGQRSFNGEMMSAKDGAAYLASRAGVPVIPVGLVNNDVLFDNVRNLRRTKLGIHIGQEFLLPDLGRRARTKDLSLFTHLIMVQIAAQLPPRYHGSYQDSPALAALLRGDDPWPHCAAAVAQAPPLP